MLNAKTHPISRVPAAVASAECVCVWNLKGKDPDTLLSATEGVRKEVALREGDTETFRSGVSTVIVQNCDGVHLSSLSGENHLRSNSIKSMKWIFFCDK